MSKTKHKHKTVGVSLSPIVRERANRRSRQLGLTFSRYVSLCVEAEVAGLMVVKEPEDTRAMGTATLPQPVPAQVAAAGIGIPMDSLPSVAVPEVLAAEESIAQRGSITALSTVATGAGDEYLLEDVAELLLRASLSFIRRPSVGGIRADFLIHVTPPAVFGGVNSGYSAGAASRNGASAASRNGSDAANRNGSGLLPGVVVECRYPSPTAYTVMLGRAVMLQQMHGVQAVLLCVPYLSAFDRAMIAVFERQRIGVTTPDRLLEALSPHLQGAMAR